MRVAANMLRDGKQNAANVAYAVGFNSEAAFNRAFKREYGEPLATWRRRAGGREQGLGERARGLPEQAVQYCTAKDGTRLAFSCVGEGPPLVKGGELAQPYRARLAQPRLAALVEGTDQRPLPGPVRRARQRPVRLGGGRISFDAFVDDLECVVEAAGLEQFDLLGISQGASVAMPMPFVTPSGSAAS